jgi:hypothetical protein
MLADSDVATTARRGVRSGARTGRRRTGVRSIRRHCTRTSSAAPIATTIKIPISNTVDMLKELPGARTGQTIDYVTLMKLRSVAPQPTTTFLASFINRNTCSGSVGEASKPKCW